jgi:hypothetical protein
MGNVQKPDLALKELAVLGPEDDPRLSLLLGPDDVLRGLNDEDLVLLLISLIVGAGQLAHCFTEVMLYTNCGVAGSDISLVDVVQHYVLAHVLDETHGAGVYYYALLVEPIACPSSSFDNSR